MCCSPFGTLINTDLQLIKQVCNNYHYRSISCYPVYMQGGCNFTLLLSDSPI